MSQLLRSLLTAVRSDFDLGKSIFTIIRMPSAQKTVLLFCCQSSRLGMKTFISGRFDLFDGFEHFFGIHLHPPLFLDLTVVVQFLDLGCRHLHEFLQALIKLAFIDLFDSVGKMSALRCDILACETS